MIIWIDAQLSPAIVTCGNTSNARLKEILTAVFSESD